MVDRVASALGMGVKDESPWGQASAAAADAIQEAPQRVWSVEYVLPDKEEMGPADCKSGKRQL